LKNDVSQVFGDCNQERNEQKLLERQGKYAMAPILQAESDRGYMIRELQNLKKEAEVMKNVEGWRVGASPFHNPNVGCRVPSMNCQDMATTRSKYQANYINALAVSVSPFFEPAEVTLGGLIFFRWVDFL
jgi:hypothetical protein